MVVHQYKSILKKEKKKWLYQENKRKREAKDEQERSQTNSEWNIIQRSLFETTLTSLVGPLLSFT